jgi:hypothetical protein
MNVLQSSYREYCDTFDMTECGTEGQIGDPHAQRSVVIFCDRGGRPFEVVCSFEALMSVFVDLSYCGLIILPVLLPTHSVLVETSASVAYFHPIRYQEIVAPGLHRSSRIMDTRLRRKHGF